MNKNILLCVCGGIAAYKSAEIVRFLQKKGHQVKVVMTEASTSFISPTTLQVLSKNMVGISLFDLEDKSNIDHISFARWADLVLIAPATANTVGFYANGICPNLLTTLLMATTAKKVWMPAMNQAMWANKSVKENIEKIKELGDLVIEPSHGEQACGEIGYGRLCDIEVAWQEIERYLKPTIDKEKLLLGKKVLITLGATKERLDPVRYLSNFSSGKMGLSLVSTLKDYGADVTAVCGSVTESVEKELLSKDINYKKVESAKEMYKATHHELDSWVKSENNNKSWFIATAAVSDYYPENISTQKKKKLDKEDSITIKFLKNPDILKTVCSRKEELNILCIGFAAETENVIDYGAEKLKKKNADIICANDVSDNNIGFSSDDNRITIINKNKILYLPQKTKKDLTEDLIEYFKNHENN